MKRFSVLAIMALAMLAGSSIASASSDGIAASVAPSVSSSWGTATVEGSAGSLDD